MANKTQNPVVYDAISSFELGIDSGVDPFLLKPTQLSFATNATMSGSYVNTRPPFLRNTLDFSLNGDPVEQKNFFQTGTYQGGCYYRPDFGPEEIIVIVSGRVYRILPSESGSCTVTEVSNPDNRNRPSDNQAWATQAERWVIIQNGVDAPLFYDGVTVRRSIPDSELLGVVAAVPSSVPALTVPPIGGAIIVPLGATYGGRVGDTVNLVSFDPLYDTIVRVGNYYATRIGDQAQINSLVLKNISGAVGATIPIGAKFYAKTITMGQVTGWGIESYGYYNYTNNHRWEDFNVNSRNEFPGWSTWIRFGAAVSQTFTVGTRIKFSHSANIFRIVKAIDNLLFRIIKDDTLSTFNRPNISFDTASMVSDADTILVAESNGLAVIPATNSNFTVPIGDPFLYGAGIHLFLDTYEFVVVSSSTYVPPSGEMSVTLINLTDAVGETIEAGSQLMSLPEIPAGRMGAYGKGRFWTALPDGISYVASDIVCGSSGSPVNYSGRDAVLKMKENTYLDGGGAFRVPGNFGQITAMRFTSTLDVTLGHGPLQVVTPEGIFSVDAPIARNEWQNVTNPLQTVSLIGFGGKGQNSTVVVNGDLMFRSVDGIRSLILAKRDFWSWGNVPISHEVERVLARDDDSLLNFASAIQFDNRLLMTANPKAGPRGTYHDSLVVINFEPSSSLNAKALPVWEGMWTGMNVLQLFDGQFSNKHRAFAISYTKVPVNDANGHLQSYTDTIEFCELTKSESETPDGIVPKTLDNNDTSIVWGFESPVIFKSVKGKGDYDLLRLEDGEVYLAGIQPNQIIMVKVEYKPDYANCWYDWHTFTVCNSAASPSTAYVVRGGLGKPTSKTCNYANGTLSTFGRWFQIRVTISGRCVFKGARFAASLQPEPEFARPICT
jgi:hypothetical protein